MKTTKKILFIAIIIILLIILLLLGKNSLAKYKTIINGDGNAQVAKPIILLEELDSTLIDATNTTGTYHFAIKNYDKNNTNEVQLKYKLAIISNTDSSITYTLYKDNKKIALINNVSEEIIMPHTNKITHDYKLEVKYDKSKSTQTTNIVEDVKLELEAIQTE